MNQVISSLIVATALANIEVDEATPSREERLCNEVQEETIRRLKSIRGYTEGTFLHTCNDGHMFFYEPKVPQTIFYITTDGSLYTCQPTTPEELNCQGVLTPEEVIEKFKLLYKSIEI